MTQEKEVVINNHIEFINTYIDSFLRNEGFYTYANDFLQVGKNVNYCNDFLELIYNFAEHSLERNQLPEGILVFIDNAFNLYTLVSYNAIDECDEFNTKNIPIFLNKMKKIIDKFDYYLPEGA